MKKILKKKDLGEISHDPKIGTTYPIRKIPYVPNAVRHMPFTIYPVKK